MRLGSSAVTFRARGSIRTTAAVQVAPADQTALRSATMYPQGMKCPSPMLSTTLFVRGSIRTTLLPALLATQTASLEAVRPIRSAQHSRTGPTRIVATTRLVAGSTRSTLGPPSSAIQTAPGETATPEGHSIWIVALTLFVAGSMRETVFSCGWDSQTAPPPAAATSPGDTWMRATTAFRAGSMRSSVEVASLIAQTAPSPTVKAPPPGGTRMLATSCAPARPVRTRVSVLDAKLLTQTESPPATTTAADASFAGGATRIGGRAATPERRSILVTVPRAGSATKRDRPALASHPGLPPT